MDVPQSLGKYEIRGTLGRGAMGVVFDGWDPLIARRVAIKSVPLPKNPDPETQQEIARFRREAQAAGRLTHPNIVAVHDYGETSDAAYIVMEHIDGPTLKALLDRHEAFPLARVQRIMDDVLTGLQFSHERGVVHRDIKPGNIMLTAAGQAKIADFGIARIESSNMTQAGMMLGTPAYMSPEQFRGEPADARTDVYSAGALLYQLLTGELPFDGGLTAIMHKALNTEPPAPTELTGTLPRAVDAVVRKAMAKRPQDRFASATAFAEALRAALAEPAGAAATAADATVVRPTRPPPRAPAAASPMPPPALKKVHLQLFAGVAVVALAVLGGAGWFFTRPAEPPPARMADAAPTIAPTPAIPSPAAPVQPPAVAEVQPVTPAPPPQVQPAEPTVAPAPPAPIQATPTAPPVADVQPAAPATPTSTVPKAPPPVQPPATVEVQPAAPAPPPQVQPTEAAVAPAPAAPVAAPSAAPAAPPPPAHAPASGAQTASIAPAALLQQVAQVLHTTRCALADATLQDDGGLAVNGLSDAATAAALRRQIGGLAGIPPVAWRMQTVDPVFCTAVSLLRPISPLAGAPGPGVGLTLRGDRTVLQDGEPILPRITMPNFDGQLRVDYLAHDGSLAHLYPTLAEPAAKRAAQPARRLSAGERLALGDPGPGKPLWEIGPPYGTDMIIAVASSTPLVIAVPQNNEDTAGAYLAELGRAIEKARAAGARVSGALLLVDAVPKAR